MPMIKSKSLLAILFLFTALSQIGCSSNPPFDQQAEQWNRSLPDISKEIGAGKVNVATPDSKITFFSYAHELNSISIHHAQFGGFTKWEGFAKLNPTPLAAGKSPIEKLAFKVDMTSVFTSLSILNDNDDPLAHKKALVQQIKQNDPNATKNLKASLLDEHLTDDHFFYTGLFPYSEFVSETIVPNTTVGTDVFTVTGKMYFLGKSLPVQFDAHIQEDASGIITAYTYLDPQEKKEHIVKPGDPDYPQANDNAKRLIIDLLRFGIGYHGFDVIPISKDVTVTVNLKFKR